MALFAIQPVNQAMTEWQICAGNNARLTGVTMVLTARNQSTMGVVLARLSNVMAVRSMPVFGILLAMKATKVMDAANVNLFARPE